MNSGRADVSRQEANLIRCASPPDKVLAGWPSLDI
jgi:hypothetical protein